VKWNNQLFDENPACGRNEEYEHAEEYDRRDPVWPLGEYRQTNPGILLRHFQFNLPKFCHNASMSADKSVPKRFHRERTQPYSIPDPKQNAKPSNAVGWPWQLRLIPV
jgi:hypothetical protein